MFQRSRVQQVVIFQKCVDLNTVAAGVCDGVSSTEKKVQIVGDTSVRSSIKTTSVAKKFWN